ncbi:MAG: MaoC/PaaZ C-terminal domain-containing protein [Pseudomonadota bacterium]
MPLNADLVGASTAAVYHSVDERWIMAYAASLNDYNPRYLDTANHTVIAHPVFPVCVEWPAILDTRGLAGDTSLSQEEAARGVHAAHDLHILAPIKAGDHLATTARMVDVKAIKPGAAYTMQLDTINTATDTLVARTYQLGIYRGVEVAGLASPAVDIPELPALAPVLDQFNQPIEVSAGAAHTYTECAHIWNPIHTDRAVALAAGLPDIILHGTATLALAVTALVDRFADGDPTRVTRLGGRFAAMVLMPSTITLRAARQDNVISYEVLNAEGQPAISGGFVCLS